MIEYKCYLTTAIGTLAVWLVSMWNQGRLKSCTYINLQPEATGKCMASEEISPKHFRFDWILKVFLLAPTLHYSGHPALASTIYLAAKLGDTDSGSSRCSLDNVLCLPLYHQVGKWWRSWSLILIMENIQKYNNTEFRPFLPPQNLQLPITIKGTCIQCL